MHQKRLVHRCIELRHKAAHHSNLSLHIAYSAPTKLDELGTSHQSEGRINAQLLDSLLPSNLIDVYICGPASFMQDQYDYLRGRGVPEEQIHMETFGPSSLRRTNQSAVRIEAELQPAEAQQVKFLRSNITRTWQSNSGSLLDLTLAAGINAPFCCQSGACGTCSTRKAAGEVHYSTVPLADVSENQVLICCARPSTAVELDL